MLLTLLRYAGGIDDVTETSIATSDAYNANAYFEFIYSEDGISTVSVETSNAYFQPTYSEDSVSTLSFEVSSLLFDGAVSETISTASVELSNAYFQPAYIESGVATTSDETSNAHFFSQYLEGAVSSVSSETSNAHFFSQYLEGAVSSISSEVSNAQFQASYSETLVVPISTESSTAQFVAPVTDSLNTSDIYSIQAIFLQNLAESSLSVVDNFVVDLIFHLAEIQISATDSANLQIAVDGQIVESANVSESYDPFFIRFGKATLGLNTATVLRRNQPRNVTVFIRSSLDHLSSISGLKPTIHISKDGGVFTQVNRVVNDLGDGVYSISLQAQDTDTLGELAIIAKDPLNLADNTVFVTTVQEDPLTKGEFIALS